MLEEQFELVDDTLVCCRCGHCKVEDLIHLHHLSQLRVRFSLDFDHRGKICDLLVRGSLGDFPRGEALEHLPVLI